MPRPNSHRVVEYMCRERKCLTRSEIERMGSSVGAVLNLMNKPCPIITVTALGLTYYCPQPAVVPGELLVLRRVFEKAIENSQWGHSIIYLSDLSPLPYKERYRALWMLGNWATKHGCEKREYSYKCPKDYVELALADIDNAIYDIRGYDREGAQMFLDLAKEAL